MVEGRRRRRRRGLEEEASNSAMAEWSCGAGGGAAGGKIGGARNLSFHFIGSAGLGEKERCAFEPVRSAVVDGTLPRPLRTVL
jgi:hypothetical protein